MTKKVYVFGNPDLADDALPLLLVPALKKMCSDILFITQDPNEEWDIENEEMTIIDTVLGINTVTVFHNLEQFTSAPRMTMHDFDAFAYLKWLWKLGKLKKIKIIGVPPKMEKRKALEEILAHV